MSCNAASQASKDAVEKMQQKLEELQNEIVEVMGQHQAGGLECKRIPAGPCASSRSELYIHALMQDKLQQEEKNAPADEEHASSLTEATGWQPSVTRSRRHHHHRRRCLLISSSRSLPRWGKGEFFMFFRRAEG